MKKPLTKFRKHILIPLCVALLILLLASIVHTYRLQKLNIFRDAQAHLEEVRHTTHTQLSENSRILNDTIDVIKMNKDLQRAWLSRDRDELFYHAAPILKKYFQKKTITHFYFMDLDRVCFLRVHKPEFYGDNINRFTLSLAMREIVSTSGVELGPFGTLTLRVVHPPGGSMVS